MTLEGVIKVDKEHVGLHKNLLAIHPTVVKTKHSKPQIPTCWSLVSLPEREILLLWDIPQCLIQELKVSFNVPPNESNSRINMRRQSNCKMWRSLQSEKAPRGLQVRAESWVTHITLIQETGVCIPCETKHLQSFHEPHQVAFVLKLMKSKGSSHVKHVLERLCCRKVLSIAHRC